jgi:hypothetical protein
MHPFADDSAAFGLIEQCDALDNRVDWHTRISWIERCRDPLGVGLEDRVSRTYRRE